MAKFIEEKKETEEVINEPSSDTQIYTCLLYTSDAADEE